MAVSNVSAEADHKTKAWQDGHSRFRPNFNEAKKREGGVSHRIEWVDFINLNSTICDRVTEFPRLCFAFPPESGAVWAAWLALTTAKGVSG